MSDRIHRILMLLAGLDTAFVGITGIGHFVPIAVIGWLAIAATMLTVGGSLWRVYFPDASSTTFFPHILAAVPDASSTAAVPASPPPGPPAAP